LRRSVLFGALCLAMVGCFSNSQAAQRIYSASSDGFIYSPSRTFSVNYTPDKAEGLQAELWYARGEGDRWWYYGVDEDGEAPVTFTAMNDGVFLLYLRPATESSAQEPPTGIEAQLKVVVDTERPVVKIISPVDQQTFARGSTMPLTWLAGESNPVENAGEISYVTPTEADWVPVALGLGLEGSIGWDPPADVLGNARLRVRVLDKAGNWGEDSVDIMITKPEPPVLTVAREEIETSASREVRINFELAEDVPSGVEEVELWATDDGGTSWAKYAIAKLDEAHVIFSAPRDGKYGFKLIGVSHAGVAEARPVEGTPPEVECMVDTEPPELFLLSPAGGESQAAGTKMMVRWWAEDENMIQRPISIYYSADGGDTWKALAQELQNSGGHMWELPPVGSDRFLVKVTALDEAGNTSEAVSRDFFAVDVSPPQVRPTGIEGAEVVQQVVSTPVGIQPATESALTVTHDEETPKERESEERLVEMANSLSEEGMFLWRKGDVSGAEGALRRAHEMAAEDVNILNNLGALLIESEKYTDSIEVLSSEAGAGDADVRYNLGVAYQRVGDLSSAVGEFKTAAALDQGLIEAKLAAAGALNGLGRQSEARTLWAELAQDKRIPQELRRRAARLSGPLGR